MAVLASADETAASDSWLRGQFSDSLALGKLLQLAKKARAL